MNATHALNSARTVLIRCHCEFPVRDEPDATYVVYNLRRQCRTCARHLEQDVRVLNLLGGRRYRVVWNVEG